MPLVISSTALAEKNKLSTDSVFLVCLEITIPGEVDPIRIVANTEDITWQGHLWQHFPFEIEEISSGSKGEVPQVNIKVSNVSRAMGVHIRAYDLYCKTNGYVPIPMSLYVVNSKNLASATPEVTHEFILKQPKCNSQWVTFVLSASNPYQRRCPQARVLKNHCRFRFKDRRCQYAGSAETCDKTLVRCRVLGNSVNFGGFPAAGSGGLNVA